MKKLNKRLKIISIVLLFTIITSLSYAYFTNPNKFFEDSIKNDGHNGLALEREATEFIVNGSGEGTMLDTVTGLTWDLNMNHNGATLKWALDNGYAEPIWNQTTKSYMWSSGRVDSDYPAFKYCNDLVLGDYDDYRLPSRDELMTLIDEIGGSGSTCSTLSTFGFTNCQNDYYWTEDEYKPSTSHAWTVYFYNGVDYSFDKSYDFYVVCVRRD